MSDYKQYILVQGHDCICGAELGRQLGVHRATIARNLRKFAEYLNLDEDTIRLGREYLLTPEGVTAFKAYILQEHHKSPLALKIQLAELNNV